MKRTLIPSSPEPRIVGLEQQRDSATMPTLARPPYALARGREAYRLRAWNEAFQLLALADRVAPLEAEDLERFAVSAYLIGREVEFHHALERAHRAWLKLGEAARAGRCAFWLGLVLFLRDQPGQAGGWFARGRGLVEDRDCAELGYFALPLAEQQLRQGQVEIAEATAASAVEIGMRSGEADLTACARMVRSRTLIGRGQAPAGLALLDEVMLAVVSGELSPIMTGLLYCSGIETCHRVHALNRMREWTAALSRWCDEQPEMLAFTGCCLVLRAEILRLHGAWANAMTLARHAAERFTLAGKLAPPGEAFYCEGELHRLRGDFAAAERAYRNAHRVGYEPQPGLALLRMDQRRVDAACATIRRLVGTTPDRLLRARLLPAHVEIMLAAGNIGEAEDACRELEEVAALLDSQLLHAAAAHARGAVGLAQGDARAALGALRRAFGLWQQMEAPHEAARVRALIGLACRLLGDEETAALELGMARGEFERLGAAPDIARLDALGGRATPAAPLSARERQVLRLVAAGKTNKAIAAELRLSARTIDRHLSNIYTKLDVPSRAAATAHAHNHRLL
jgi:DNA-binding NarL/FixJ family response regulator